MKKVLILAAAALLMMCSQATASPCYPCDGKYVCDLEWECPSTDQSSCTYAKPCPVIVKVCDCAEADEFIEGAEIAVKLQSLTEGVYFDAEAIMDADGFLYITDRQPECRTQISTDSSGNPVYVYFDNYAANLPYMDPNSSRSDWGGDPNATAVTKWNQFAFYTMDADEDSTLQSTVQANPSDYRYDQTECEVPEIAKFTEIKTVNAMGDLAGYIVDGDDGLWWTIVIPQMVVDWEEAMVNKGTYAQVKVELVLVEEVGICQDCTVICECIHEVFRICEEESSEIMFPYVLNNVDLWSSGIAISNLETSIAPNEMVVEFTIIDNAGAMHTATKADFTTQVTAWTFESLLAELGLTIADGAAVLYAQGNFMIDGYQFNLYLDGTMIFGAGVLPRVPYGNEWL